MCFTRPSTGSATRTKEKGRRPKEKAIEPLPVDHLVMEKAAAILNIVADYKKLAMAAGMTDPGSKDIDLAFPSTS